MNSLLGAFYLFIFFYCFILLYYYYYYYYYYYFVLLFRIYSLYLSNRSFNRPFQGIWHLCRAGEKESSGGMGNLIHMHRGWGIWNILNFMWDFRALHYEVIVRPFAEALFKIETTLEGKILASWAIDCGVKRSTQAVFGGIYLLLLFCYDSCIEYMNTLCLQLQYNRYRRSNLCDDLICRWKGLKGHECMECSNWSRWTSRADRWFSHDVTKIQTKKISILPRFYFHDVLEQLKTNFHTNFCFKKVLGFVIECAWISKLLRDAAFTWRPRELSSR